MLLNFTADYRVHAVGLARSGRGRPPDLLPDIARAKQVRKENGHRLAALFTKLDAEQRRLSKITTQIAATRREIKRCRETAAVLGCA